MEEMKVIKEQTDEFGEITVVVIDGECYFLFSDVDYAMRLERRSRYMQEGYSKEAFRDVDSVKGFRMEDVPGVGEKQLLINFHGVKKCYDVARYSLWLWVDDEGIGRKREEEMKKWLFSFFRCIAELNHKHEDKQEQEKKKEPIKKAMSAITREEI